MCDKCWANNDGGVWCHKHPVEVTEKDCEECEQKEIKDDSERIA